MKHRFFHCLTIMVILWIGFAQGQPAPVRATSIAQSTIQATDNGVVFAIKLDPVTVQPTPQGLSIRHADWLTTQPEGAPQLPSKQFLIAVPTGMQAVLHSSTAQPRQTYHGQPTIQPTQKLSDPVVNQGKASATMQLSYELDPTLRSASYPQHAVALGTPFQVRDQVIVPLQVFAAQWDAVNQSVQTFEQIHAEVEFVATAKPISNPRGSDQASLDAVRAMVVNPASIQQAEIARPTVPATIQKTTGIRLRLAKSGVYKVLFQDLINAGAPTTWRDNPNFLRVFQDTTELPRSITADGFMFYLPAYDPSQLAPGGAIIRYTPQQAGQTIATRTVSTAVNPTTSYTDHAIIENSSFYASAAPLGEYNDAWWDSYWYIRGNGLPANPLTKQVQLPSNAILSQPSQVSLHLYGSSNTSHTGQVWVNGTLIDTFQWSGIGLYQPTLNIPANLLTSTTTISIAPQGLAYDIVYLDWLDLAYTRSLVAENGQLEFVGQATSYAMSGLAGAELDVWDVSNATNPQLLQGYSNDALSLRWSDQVNRHYIVQTRVNYATPQQIVWFNQPDLHFNQNQADYLAITYNPPTDSSWSSALVPLMNLRQQQGLHTQIIDAQWIYDQFGDGRPSQYTIRAFMMYSYYSWQTPAPRYVLLVGDSTYDPRNFLQMSNPAINYLPTYMAVVDPWIKFTSADNQYVTLSGSDDVPDMLLGRIPARSTTDIDNYFEKVKLLEQTNTQAAWLDKFLLVADDPDTAGNFHAFSNNIKAFLPSTVVSTTLYYQTGADAAVFRTNVVQAINQGQLFVNYIGHAGLDIWAYPELYNYDSINKLTNTHTPSIFLEMTCYTGFFHDPWTASLAEKALLKPTGGAVADWAATGLGLATGHDYLNSGFVSAVYTYQLYHVGEATLSGKIWLASNNVAPDLLNTYLLFGDPAVKIPFMYSIYAPLVLK